MISSIGFIPNTSDIKELKAFVPDETIQKKLSYLQIPILNPEEPADSDIVDEGNNAEDKNYIKETDSIVFSTPNTEEMSYCSIYGYDEEEMFFHHDFFVFSTILDSTYLGNNLIALATFEPDVLVYDFLTKFPVLPQHLLCGHESFVTSIKNKENKIVSSSDDKSIIEWDLNTFGIKSQNFYDVSIERFDFEGKSLAFAQKNYLCINNENFSLDYDIEQLKIRGDKVYATDAQGYVSIYDMRNLEKKLFSKKIHDAAAVDILILEECIVTSSLDGTVKFWDTNFDIKDTKEQESPIYCLGYNPYSSYNEIFGGSENDQVIPIKL